MSEHTKLPWTCRPRHFDDWGFIRGADGQLACIARGHSEKEFDQHRMDKTDPYEANAAFILKAVNNHEALVKALQSASAQCGNVIFNCEQRPADNERHMNSWRGVKEFIDASLAQAGFPVGQTRGSS
jgi:hypothetical protein